MQPNEYQKLALKTERTPRIIQSHALTDEDATRLDRLIHAAFGACTETGELQDMIKKHLIYGKEFDPINVIEECGDVLWYLALALDACGFTLEDCMERNINKLRARFGGAFTEEKALTRDLDTERNVLSRSTETLSIGGAKPLRYCSWCGVTS